MIGLYSTSKKVSIWIESALYSEIEHLKNINFLMGIKNLWKVSVLVFYRRFQQQNKYSKKKCLWLSKFKWEKSILFQKNKYNR